MVIDKRLTALHKLRLIDKHWVNPCTKNMSYFIVKPAYTNAQIIDFHAGQKWL